MGLFPSPSFLARSVGANTAKLGMDLKGWEKIMAFLETRGWVPTSPLTKLAALVFLFFLGAMAEWHIGEKTFLAKVFKEVLGDIPSELGSRILLSPATPLDVVVRPPNTSLALRPNNKNSMERVAETLFPWTK
jgi:hypothetical protein